MIKAPRLILSRYTLVPGQIEWCRPDEPIMLGALDTDNEPAVIEPVLAGIEYRAIAKKRLHRPARRHPGRKAAVGFELHESNRLLAIKSRSLLGGGVLGMKRNQFPEARYRPVLGSERVCAKQSNAEHCAESNVLDELHAVLPRLTERLKCLAMIERMSRDAPGGLCDSLLASIGLPCLFLRETPALVGARSAHLIYGFEDYELDPDRRELRKSTARVAVEPLVFDLLQYLIGSRARVASKNDLIATVWRGRVVSDSTLTSRMNAARNAIGDSGEQQRLIRTIPRKGFRFVGEVHEIEPARLEARSIPAAHRSGDASDAVISPVDKQTMTFCRTKGGINLATASIGHGPPLIRAALWATNIEYDWQSPITGPLLQRLAMRFHLIRYDGRGAGLSDRNVADISFATMLEDLETVVDSSKFGRFALLGISGGAASSIVYAVRHPERVSRLVLLGGYAQGRNMRGSPQYADEARAFQTMLRSGWGDEHSVFMRAFCSFFIPGASANEIKSFVDFQRMATTGENAIKLRSAVDDIDIVSLLPQVSVPTIVFHSIHDNLVPFDQGRRLAALIPNAKFVPLESANHALLSNELAWEKFVTQTEEFLADRY